MAISHVGPPHQSSGPFLGRAVLDASTSTAHLINYSLGIKEKSSPSDARRGDLSDDGQASSNEAGYGPSVTRDLTAATGLSWAEGVGTMTRDSISEGLNHELQAGTA